MACQIEGNVELRSPEVQADLIVRLKRIEGQVRGVQKMVEQERDCPDILQQMTAIRSAMHQASLILARAYASGCLMESNRGDMDTMLDQLMATLRKLE